MGIPIYFYTISKSYPGILHSQHTTVDYLYIDFNGIIHTSAQKILKDTEAPVEELTKAILVQIWEDTLKIINDIKPTCCTKIYTDGVAPLAKICQQRKRRYLSTNSKGFQIWDRNCISPCTDFMTTLAEYIRTQIRCSGLTNIVYFSGSDEPGEGEQKIFKDIVQIDGNSRVMIHGLDADLIMLSICSHKNNIILMREDHMTATVQHVNIDKLKDGIISEFRKFDKRTPQKDLLESYLVLCFLLGNDFIPHLITTDLRHNGYTKLIAAYNHIVSLTSDALVVDSQINIEFLQKLVIHLASTEEQEILHVIKDNTDFISSSIKTNPAQWRSIYYQNLFGTKESVAIKAASKSFIDGIFWTFDYYKQRNFTNDYYYIFNYPPTLKDISNELNTLVQKQTSTSNSHEPFLDPIVQLLCILPYSSIDIIPDKYQSIMTDVTLGCKHLFPKKFVLQTFCKSRDYEFIPLLPVIDHKLLKNVVGKLK